MHDLIDHGAGKHKLEEAEFARIDAQAEKEKKKASGLRGGVRLVLLYCLLILMFPCSSSTLWIIWTVTTSQNLGVQRLA